MGAERVRRFEDLVPGSDEPEAKVRLASDRVLSVDVEPEPAVRRGLGDVLYVREERAKNAAPPCVVLHPDALNPEEAAVSPVAPLEGGHQLPHHPAVELREKIAPLRGVAKYGVDPARDRPPIEPQPFGVFRKREIETHDDSEIVGGGVSDPNRALIHGDALSSRSSEQSPVGYDRSEVDV